MAVGKEEQYLIALVCAVLKGEQIPAPVQGTDFARLYRLAASQGVAGIAKSGLDAVSLPDEIRVLFADYADKAIMKAASQQAETERILSAFEKSGVDCIPLKGIVIKDLYPSSEFRVMSDIDIYINKQDTDKAREIMEMLGFRFTERLSYQDIYEKRSVGVELHFALWGYGFDKVRALSDPFSAAVKAGGKEHIFLLTHENFYLFLIAHLTKHYKSSGIGIRAFIDIWVYMKAYAASMDWKYIKNVVESMGITKFEITVRHLLKIWFFGEPSNVKYDIITEHLFRAGTHGSDRQKLTASLAANGSSKTKGFFALAFPGFAYMKRRFPVLESAPFLLPVFWFVRPFAGKKNIKEKYSDFSAVKKEDIERLNEVLELSGIETEKSGGNARANLLLVLAAVAVLAVVGVIFRFTFYQTEKGGIEVSENESALPSGSGATETTVPFSADYATYAWGDGVYTGYSSGGVPNGTGELKYTNGDRYVGGFLDGVLTGNGVYYYSNGDRYEGFFSDGKKNGQGTLYYTNGDILSGEFAADIPNGQCLCTYANGNIYSGMFIDGVQTGEGTFTWTNGNEYTGTFLDGIRDGYGEYTWFGGATYKGYWKNNNQNGYGEYTDKKCKYEGNFVDGTFSGEGKYTWASGDVYMGEFVGGNMTDEDADIVYADGSKYKGGIKLGELNGKGELTHANGDIVKGTFAGGLLNGEAEYYTAAKKKWEKLKYENGEIVGYGG